MAQRAVASRPWAHSTACWFSRRSTRGSTSCVTVARRCRSAPSSEAARRSVKAAEAAIEATFAQLHEVRNAQKAAEDEAATVEEKAVEVDRMLYGGTITAAKELEAYQADLAMLKERQSSLEDVALEQMERAEPLEAELAKRRAEARRRRGRGRRHGVPSDRRRGGVRCRDRSGGAGTCRCGGPPATGGRRAVRGAATRSRRHRRRSTRGCTL